MKRINLIILAMLLSLPGLFPLCASDVSAQDSAGIVQQSDPPNVKKLRGKLLSKRNKIRRLEKNAMQKDPALRDKIEELGNQRQSLFIAANSELKELYSEEAVMVQEIDRLSAKK